MERDRLREEVDAWVDDGIISREQAEAILERYEDDSTRSRSRIVLAISLIGALLVGVGIALYLAANWADLPRWIRTIVLLLTPAAAFGAGTWCRDRGRAPRVGHALSFLGAAFVGISAFLLADLYAPDLDPEWPLLAWATVALPTGHALRSRPVMLLGLGVVAGVLLALHEPTDPALVIAFYGVTLYGIALLRRERDDASKGVERAYVLAAVAGTFVGALVLLFLVGTVPTDPDFEVTGVLLATASGAVLAVAVGVRSIRRGAIDRAVGAWPAVCVAALFAGAASVRLFPPFAAFLVNHAFVLIVLLSTVVAGYRDRSTGMVNAATVAFVIQLLLFVEATVLEALSGSIALVVAGLSLLAVGLALERGRRTLLDHMA